MLNPITCNRPRAILGFVLACFAMAALALAFASCSSGPAMTPDEQTAMSVKEKQLADLEAQAQAIEDRMRAAGAKWVDAFRNGKGAAAQAAALTEFENARADYLGLNDQMERLVDEMSAMHDAAARRQTEPFEATATLLGVPAPIAKIGGAIAAALAFPRPRRVAVSTIKGVFRGDLLELLVAPFRAAGLIDSKAPPEALIERAVAEARKNGDVEFEKRLLAALNPPQPPIAAAPVAAPE